MRRRPDEDRDLLCVMTIEDKELQGTQLAETQLASERLSAEKKVVVTEFKKNEDRLAVIANTLATNISTGKHRQSVVCKWTTTTTGGGKKGGVVQSEWLLIREDTGEVVAREPVTAADRQTGLDFPEGN